eukprot:TRINITY_DN4150_c0_g1_i4.p1 TRINITY_DN4150_c0_g1~~TRINITY_DN4150_c0_g1_i4.p1  ORF type:complete len:449 (-),score=60.76 TRINITY_DN4150_c0_g1_i4:2025-3371(-)
MEVVSGATDGNVLPFPQDLQIDQVREAIRGRTDFREVPGPDYSAFIYFLGMAKDIFPNPLTAPDPHTALLYRLRRECRGLIFSHDGKVLARRFHKFFNVGETEETEADNIDLSQPYVIMEKLDGSMVSPFYTGGLLRFATKQGITDTSLIVEEHVKRLKQAGQADYMAFSTEWTDKGFTTMYEWCSRRSRIVLDYPEDVLTLVAIRNMHTGQYITYREMAEIAKESNIPVVKARTPADLGIGESVTGFKDFQQAIREKNIGLEGFVMRFESGMMLKIKTRWYCDINKSLDLISRSRSKRGSETTVIKVILDEQYDDLKGWVAEDERSRLDRFASDLLKNLTDSAVKLFQYTYNEKVTLKTNRKEFAHKVQADTSLHPSEKASVFTIWKLMDINGDNVDMSLIRNSIIEFVKKNLGSARTYEQVRCLAGGMSYEDYFSDYVPAHKGEAD